MTNLLYPPPSALEVSPFCSTYHFCSCISLEQLWGAGQGRAGQCWEPWLACAQIERPPAGWAPLAGRISASSAIAMRVRTQSWCHEGIHSASVGLGLIMTSKLQSLSSSLDWPSVYSGFCLSFFAWHCRSFWAEAAACFPASHARGAEWELPRTSTLNGVLLRAPGGCQVSWSSTLRKMFHIFTVRSNSYESHLATEHLQYG